MRIICTVLLAGLLAGCGPGETEQAVEACADAVAEKLGDERNYRLDRKAMAAAAEATDDVVHVKAPIVFDPDLPREYTQTVDCKARFAEGADAPDVISLNFIW